MIDNKCFLVHNVLKNILIVIVVLLSGGLLCNFEEINSTIQSGSTENQKLQNLLSKRKKISKIEYRRLVTDSLMDNRTLKVLYNLYQLPVKRKCIFSVAACFDYRNNPLYKKTQTGYQPLSLAETPELNSSFKKITGRKPRLNGIDLTYALDEYWELFTHEIVPSGPSINEKYKSYLISCIRKAFNDYGSIPIITYHMPNPYSPLPPYQYGAYAEYKDREHKNVVGEMRNGTGTRCGFKGKNETPRAYLDEKLDAIALFIQELTDKHGKPIPCIIRLFHEMDMNSFWWGVNYCSSDDYKWLYKYSTDVIREKVNTHNLIWGYSLGNKFVDYNAMMERYPGDNYVDIIGGDEYNLGLDAVETNYSLIRCKLITKESINRNKVSCLFESGVANIGGGEELLNGDFYRVYLPELISHESVFFSFILGYNGPFSIPTSEEGKKKLRMFSRMKQIIR